MFKGCLEQDPSEGIATNTARTSVSGRLDKRDLPLRAVDTAGSTSVCWLVHLLFGGDSFSGLKWPFLCSLFIAEGSRERKGGRGRRREEGKGADPKKIHPSRPQDSGMICFLQS